MKNNERTWIKKISEYKEEVKNQHWKSVDQKHNKRKVDKEKINLKDATYAEKVEEGKKPTTGKVENIIKK